MKSLNHPNLVKMLGVCIEKSPFYLVQVKSRVIMMPFCYDTAADGGDYWHSRSCAAMAIFEITWSPLTLWNPWVRWLWQWLANLLMNWISDKCHSNYVSGGKEQGKVWKGAKVSKIGQLVHGHHQRWSCWWWMVNMIMIVNIFFSRHVLPGDPLPRPQRPCC